MSRSIYWLVMKLILWILLAVIVIKLSKQKFSDVIGLYRFRSALIWGIGIGLILGIITIITKLLLSQPIFAFTLNWSLFSGLIVAPITEEITFRGAVLSLLKQRYIFALANFYTGILFLGIHLPGMIGYLYEIPNPILGR